MEFKDETVTAILEATLGDLGYWDYASEYGEPGYSFRHDATTPGVVLGDYWCKCGKVLQEDGSTELHGYEYHHPRIWKQLEAQGIEFEWCDEWVVVDDKAYRTTPNSYSWRSSIQWTDDGEWLTPDDDISEWIEWAKNDESRCITAPHIRQEDMDTYGYRQFNGEFQNGWHSGMDDDPSEITARLRAEMGDDVSIVFKLSEASQFYIGFECWIKGEK